MPIIDIAGMNEKLDVLDPDTWEPIGTEPLHVVHARKLLHRSVRVWWIDGNGRAWFRRRADTEKAWPCKYGPFAAGHVAAGEDPLQAAVREIEEKTGIAVDPASLLHPADILMEIRRPDGCTEKEIACIYVVKSGGQPVPKPSEGTSGWASAQLAAYASMMYGLTVCNADVFAFDGSGKLVHAGYEPLEERDFCLCGQMCAGNELQFVISGLESAYVKAHGGAPVSGT